MYVSIELANWIIEQKNGLMNEEIKSGDITFSASVYYLAI